MKRTCEPGPEPEPPDPETQKCFTSLETAPEATLDAEEGEAREARYVGGLPRLTEGHHVVRISAQVCAGARCISAYLQGSGNG